MTDASRGWEPLRTPERARSSTSPPDDSRATGFGNGLVITAFTKLARVQVLSSFGDGLIAVALAGSIFFSIDPDAARGRVALYLILTIAPFGVVTPLLGPAIDRARGGRRGMIIGSLAGRAVVAFLMVRHIDSLLLFPEAFVMLVLQKAYFVSRSALVPTVVPHEEELIEANSKLSLISSFSGIFGGAIGAALVLLFGGGGATGLAVAIYFTGALMAIALPHSSVATEPADITERHEVRGANILLAATTVGVMRGIVGFTTFLLAFHLRAGEDGIDRTEPGAAVGAALGTLRGVNVEGTPGPPTWHFGAAGLAAGIGAFLGARYAPRLREATNEERIIFGALAGVATMAFLGAWGGGIGGTVVLAFGVGIAAALAKLGFDALVQRDAPDANHGRTFASFEGRFQVMWAVGAFIPVIIPIGIRLGALLVALAAAIAAASYEIGRRTDTVRRSSRLREALRDRVPDGAVDRLGLTPVIDRVRPVASRFGIGAAEPDRPDTPDPTAVAPRPDAARPPEQSGGGAAPIDSLWGDAAEPHLSSGSGVWLAPEDPDADPTVDLPREPGEGGQFRLWADDADSSGG